MTITEKKKVLAASPLFAGLPDEILLRAAEAAEELTFARGEKLAPRENGRVIGVIVSGAAWAVKPKEHGSVTMNIMGANDVFGAATIMGGELPSTEVRAKKAVRALVFSAESFLSLMESDFGVTRCFCRYLTDRIRFLTGRVECMAGSSAAEKLMRYLEKNSENGVYHIAIGMDALAKAISLSRATLYRALDELEKNGKIARKGREIRLL